MVGYWSGGVVALANDEIQVQSLSSLNACAVARDRGSLVGLGLPRLQSTAGGCPAAQRRLKLLGHHPIT